MLGKSMLVTLRTMFVVLLFTLAATTAFADEQPADAPYGIEVSTYGQFMGKSDFDGSDASFSQQTYGVTMRNKYFVFEYEKSDFSWDNASSLQLGNSTANNPWDSLQSLSLAGRRSFKLSKSWRLMTVGAIGASFEDEITADALEYGAFGLFTYEYSDNLVFYIGGGVSKDGLGWEAMPAASIEYTYDAWEIVLGIPKTYVQYTFNDQWGVKAAFDGTGGLYRLSKDNKIQKEGYVDIEGNLIGLYVHWTPLEDFSITAGPEYYFGRSMQIYDKDGDKVGNSPDIDNGYGGVVALTYSF